MTTETYNYLERSDRGDRIMEPTHFQGLTTEDAREWIEKTEAWFIFKNYTSFPNPDGITDADEKRTVLTAIALAKRRTPPLLTMLLQGSAGDWLKGLSDTDKETFDAFKVKFKSRYFPDRFRYKAVTDVWGRKQDPTESVDTYYDVHMKLVKLAELTIDVNTSQAFIHGLLPHLKVQVMMQGKTAMTEIVEAARLAELAYASVIEPEHSTTSRKPTELRKRSSYTAELDRDICDETEQIRRRRREDNIDEENSVNVEEIHSNNYPNLSQQRQYQSRQRWHPYQKDQFQQQLRPSQRVTTCGNRGNYHVPGRTTQEELWWQPHQQGPNEQGIPPGRQL
jgi:hypothetical protein